MASYFTFFLKTPVKDLEKIVEAFQESFDELLQDTFSDDELTTHEKLLDQMGAIIVQPVLEELTFDDFEANPEQEQSQRDFFEKCRSSVLFENLPYLETNPFQVTYLKEFAMKFEQVLVDRGGLNELLFKDDFLSFLGELRDMDALLRDQRPVPKIARTTAPVGPMDFLVVDVYKELEKARQGYKLKAVEQELLSMSPNINRIYQVMQNPGKDAESLMLGSKLNPKEFGDQLERFKFFLRRINSGN